MAEREETKGIEGDEPTLDNLTEAVGKTSLSDLPEKARILIRLAEVQKEKECEAARAIVDKERTQYKEKYKASLRELENLLSILRPADLIKIVPAISIAYVIAVVKEEGLEIYKNTLADFLVLAGILSIIYILSSWRELSQRAKEIKRELEKEEND